MSILICFTTVLLFPLPSSPMQSLGVDILDKLPYQRNAYKASFCLVQLSINRQGTEKDNLEELLMTLDRVFRASNSK